MLLRRGWWLLLVWGCSGKEPDPGVPPELPENEPPTTTSPPLTASRPEFACFADVTVTDPASPFVGNGLQGYDEANPTWLLYEDLDSNGNGLFDYVELYERDASGNATRVERQRASAYIGETTYDARNNPLTYIYDEGGDGTIDAAYAYTWDANDQLLHYEEDADGDGQVDYSYDYERTPEGVRLTASEDDDGDGDYDDFYTYTHDEFGRETLLEMDEGIDGVIDATRITTYTDPVLRVGRSEYDDGVDAIVDEVIEFEYDEDGRELYYAIDLSPPDGIWDEVEVQSYDAEGRLVTRQYVYDNDGNPYSYDYTYTYDALGRIVQDTLLLQYLSGEVLTDQQTAYAFGGTCP
jgi:hypothetical protein